MTVSLPILDSTRIPTPSRRIVAALSGGVDSSTVAAILHHQGYEVVGVTLWLMKGKGQCCTDGLVDAAALCDQLRIPHHVVDSRDTFEQNIVNYLVSGYSDGITPLPCSQCNKTVKFSPLLRYAQRELGISQIATGHYARIRYSDEQQRYQLLRALDRQKDQSYFLYDLDQESLAGTLFPLGEYTKTQTRQIAAQYGLATAEKPESQDLCLIETHGSMRQFLDQHIPPRQGEIVDVQGNILGHHEGIHHFTLGQRKGIGIAAAHPLYVIKLDAAMNRVVVGERQEAISHETTVGRVNWVSIPCPEAPIPVTVQIRYRSEAVPATVIPLPDPQGNLTRARLVFVEPQFSVTPGQGAVWYDGEVLLGGGILERQVG